MDPPRAAGGLALILLASLAGCTAARPRAELAATSQPAGDVEQLSQQVSGQLAAAIGKAVELNARVGNQVAALAAKVDESSTTNEAWPYVLICALLVGGAVLMGWIRRHSYLVQKPIYEERKEEAAKCDFALPDRRDADAPQDVSGAGPPSG